MPRPGPADPDGIVEVKVIERERNEIAIRHDPSIEDTTQGRLQPLHTCMAAGADSRRSLA